jgi:hypothetical protein
LTQDNKYIITPSVGSDLSREVIAIVKDGSVHLVEDTRAFPSLYANVKAFTYSGVVFRFVFEM